jgi:hypothetical protein
VTSASPLSNRDDLATLFAALGRELDVSGTVAEIVMVGGSWLLWHGQRAATRDVDSAKRLEDDVVDAVRRVAARHDLADDWLNDRAAMFWPADADAAQCRVALETGGLTVKVPPARVVFVMKLYRALPQDYEDMVLLWPQCGFTDAAAAADAFWRAYPHAPADEFLTSYIDGIAAEGNRSNRPAG